MQQTNLKNRFIRLVKVISHSGYCSRREAEGLITSGKVLLNGHPYKEFLIQPEEIKKLSINGKKLSIQKTRLWCFNKSTGLICSNSNQYDKKTIFEVLPSLLPRVVTVGRLDINPTVSENRTVSSVLNLKSALLVVVSKVANNLSSACRPPFVSMLNSEVLPAFV